MEKVRKSQGMQKMSKLEEIIKSSGLYIFANTHFSQEQADCEAEDLAKKRRWSCCLKKKSIFHLVMTRKSLLFP